MRRETYYIENSTKLNFALEMMSVVIPCFIEREYLEMDYSQVTITACEEDYAIIEEFLAPLV